MFSRNRPQSPPGIRFNPIPTQILRVYIVDSGWTHQISYLHSIARELYLLSINISLPGNHYFGYSSAFEYRT